MEFFALSSGYTSHVRLRCCKCRPAVRYRISIRGTDLYPYPYLCTGTISAIRCGFPWEHLLCRTLGIRPDEKQRLGCLLGANYTSPLIRHYSLTTTLLQLVLPHTRWRDYPPVWTRIILTYTWV